MILIVFMPLLRSGIHNFSLLKNLFAALGTHSLPEGHSGLMDTPMKKLNSSPLTVLFLVFLATQTLQATTFDRCHRLDTLDFTTFDHELREALPPKVKITSILVRKDLHRLYLLNHDRIVKSYPVALGPSPRGHKTEEGDLKTPEGIYHINFKNADSAYHKSLQIDYPQANDRAQAVKRGALPGSDIFIHGLPNGTSLKSRLIARVHPSYDWTLGCIAVTNEEIDEIYEVVKIGTEIEICPY